MIARAKNSVAQARRPSSMPPSDSSRTANTGTTASRSTVSALGRLTRRAVWGGVAAGSGATSLTASPSGRGEGEDDGGGDEVDALGADDLGGHDLAGPGAGRDAGD